MRRADRLFQIVAALRRRRTNANCVTARELADLCEVSERTIYRDIRDLEQSGVPILGEAGVGYRLRPGFELPPLMFTAEEVEALVLGASMVTRFGDADLKRAASAAIDKAHAVLPEAARQKLDDTRLFAMRFFPLEGTQHLRLMRTFIEERRRVRISYCDREGAASQRVIRPVALNFWGRTWTTGGWCELRSAHRSFRLDRLREIEPLDTTFADRSPDTLNDFIEAMKRS